jgi:methylated-DNA-[protein]-cysteine S-methyltransferase
MTKLALQIERMRSPVGGIFVVTDAHGRLRAVEFEDHEERLHRLLRRYYGAEGFVLGQTRARSDASRSLEAYFAGDFAAIDNLDVETGGTPFQRKVWKALRRIPSGQTMSYGALAARVERPRAVRAVGLANGANPVVIVVPCHRVIGADASLTGYGGGLARKKWLLQHEGVPVQ